jgi:chloramphenicol 3-O phosphotransferase
MVVILNGAPSSGKSSIIRSMQALATGPWLAMGPDRFLPMLPARYVDLDGTGSPEGQAGLRWRRDAGDAAPAIRLESGPLGAAWLEAMRVATAAVARLGHDVLVEDVITCNAGWRAWAAALGGIPVLTVAVRCPLDTLERRESARTDRQPGHARGVHRQVRDSLECDFVVDTEHASPEECAAAILSCIEYGPPPTALAQLVHS